MSRTGCLCHQRVVLPLMTFVWTTVPTPFLLAANALQISDSAVPVIVTPTASCAIINWTAVMERMKKIAVSIARVVGYEPNLGYFVLIKLLKA